MPYRYSPKSQNKGKKLENILPHSWYKQYVQFRSITKFTWCLIYNLKPKNPAWIPKLILPKLEKPTSNKKQNTSEIQA